MENLKEIIQQKISSPAAHTGGSLITIAKILQSDEKNNLCQIQYIDKNGIMRNRDNIPVRLTGSSWFPIVDDKVVIEDHGKYANIVSKFDGSYATDERAKNELKQDNYADTGTNSCGGYIF